MNSAGAPVEQSNVVLRAVLGFVGERNGIAVVGPVRALLANRGGVRQVNRLAAVTRYRVKVPKLVARMVLLVDDPFAVRRPDGIELAIIGLGDLDRPPPRGAHLPEI